MFKSVKCAEKNAYNLMSEVKLANVSLATFWMRFIERSLQQTCLTVNNVYISRYNGL